jgi:hypothetical protein
MTTQQKALHPDGTVYDLAMNAYVTVFVKSVSAEFSNIDNDIYENACRSHQFIAFLNL